MPATTWTGENNGSAPDLGQGPDESADAGGIDPAVPLEGRADDETGSLGQELVEVFKGGAAADQERSAGAAEWARRR